MPEAISLISNCVALATAVVCLVAATRPHQPQPPVARVRRRPRRERN